MKALSAKPVSRRSFLEGFSLSFSYLALEPLQNFGVDRQALFQTNDLNQRNVYIFNDQALFDSSGRMPTYLPPKSLASNTQKYLDSISQREFLSRHWFV